MKYIDLFSGIIPTKLAWKHLGWKAVAYAETNPFCSEVIAERSPAIPNLGDVMSANWEYLRGNVDLIIGGSPCQPFSLRGKRRSLEDPRAQLSFQFIKIFQQTNAAIGVLENVPNLLNTKDNAFGHLLARGMGTDTLFPPGGKWGDAGFLLGRESSIGWRVVDARRFNSPQRRRRLFVIIVNFREGERIFRQESPENHQGLCTIPAKILFESQSGRGDFAALRGQLHAPNPKRCFEQPTEIIGFSCKDNGGDAGTLLPTFRSLNHDGSWLNGGGNAAIAMRLPNNKFIVRKLTPAECLKAMGYPMDWLDVSLLGKPAADCHKYQAIGNAMDVNVLRWLGNKIVELQCNGNTISRI